MQPPPFDQQVRQCHAAYLTAMNSSKLPLTFQFRELWERFLYAGFTLEDLKKVIRYWQKEMAIRGTSPGVLRLSNLIEPQRFGETLCLAEATMRPQPTPKERVVQQFRPIVVEPTKENVKRASEVVNKCLEQFRRECPN